MVGGGRGGGHLAPPFVGALPLSGALEFLHMPEVGAATGVAGGYVAGLGVFGLAMVGRLEGVAVRYLGHGTVSPVFPGGGAVPQGFRLLDQPGARCGDVACEQASKLGWCGKMPGCADEQGRCGFGGSYRFHQRLK